MSTTAEPAGSDAVASSSAEFARWIEQLADIDPNTTDAELINRISQLEQFKSACAAAQAACTVAFVASQTDGLPAAKARDERTHRSIASQIAVARKDSPARGDRHVGLARALIREMPHTFKSLQTGEISEWRATLLVRETACLSLEHRQQVDTELAGKLGGLGDRGTAQAAATIAQRLDAAACVKRHRKAVNDRRVSIRPAPDTMTYVSALLPVAHGVAVYAALTKHADTARATGDPRSRGQVMADEFVTRITQPAAAATEDEEENVDIADRAGNQNPTASSTAHSAAENVPAAEDAANVDNETDAGAVDEHWAGTETHHTATDTTTPAPVPAGVNLDIQLIMTDRTLFDRDNEPAHLVGYGPIPAPLARQLIRDASPTVKAWIRRLYTDPETGQLINGDARRRFFGHAERQFFIARDQFCRSPYCDAPIRHNDHIEGHANNGRTDINDGQGLCENCNYLKEAPGWSSRTEPDSATITITTPTGHTHRSNPPPPPRSEPWAETPTPDVETRLADLLRANFHKPDARRVDITYPELRWGRRFEVA